MAIRKQEVEKQERWKPTHEEIMEFEKKFHHWALYQDENESDWEFYAQYLGHIKIEKTQIGAVSGRLRCKGFTVMNPIVFTKMSRLYSEMQAYRAGLERAERQKLKQLETLKDGIGK